MDNYDKLMDKKIAIIQYPQGEMNYSYGKIIEMTYEAKYEFAHDASNDKASSGSPIFLKGKTKVVGIHKGGIEIVFKDKIIKKILEISFGQYLVISKIIQEMEVKQT